MGRPDSQIVLKDDRVVLLCVSEGRPPPAITWLKQLVQVEESDRVSIDIVLRGARQVASNLTIEPVQPRDSGQFTCMASNVAGNDSQSADLTMHGRCIGRYFRLFVHSTYFYQFFLKSSSWFPRHCSL